MSETNNNINRKKIIRTAAIPASLYGLLKGQLHFLNQYYEILGVASEGDLMPKIEDREGIKTKSINIERNISPLKDLISLYQLYRFFKKEKPCMVHSITPKAGLLTMSAAYLAKVPVRAHTFTGLIFPTQEGFMKKLLLFFDKIICSFATHIYPEGNGVKNDLLNYNVTKKPLMVIANGNVNGKDMTYFDPSIYSKEALLLKRNEFGIEPKDFVFIFIGRLVNDKGVNELVHAFKELLKKEKNVKLLLVGSYEGETDILPESTLNMIKEEEHIICAGQQNDVRPFLCLSNALVFPSYREGFPNVVLEAGAMGLPSIVTDINGSNEIIKQNENGVIIPSKNESALFEAMHLFLNNEELLNKMHKNARPMITSRYEQSQVWNALLEEYNRILITD